MKINKLNENILLEKEAIVDVDDNGDIIPKEASQDDTAEKVKISPEVKQSMDAFGFSTSARQAAKNLASLNRRANDDLETALTSMYEANREEYIACKDAVNPDSDKPEEQAGVWNDFEAMNLLITGEPGGGKTSIIKAWAKSHGIHLVTVTGSSLTPEMIQGFPTVIDSENGQELHFIPSTYFKGLKQGQGKMTVLFIDEINRSNPAGQAALLNLIQSHELPNMLIETGVETYEKFLFTIAAQNPPESNEEILEMGGELGNAMTSRFKGFWWVNDPKKTAKWAVKNIRAKIKGQEAKLNDSNPDVVDDAKTIINKSKGRQQIWEALANSDKFSFDDESENQYLNPEARRYCGNQNVGTSVNRRYKTALNARTLNKLINECNGQVGEQVGTDKWGDPVYTEGSFLENFKPWCGDNDETFEMVEDILKPLQDAQDKAKGVTESWMYLYKQLLGI